MNNTPEQLKRLPNPLLKWYDENCRVLPWRENVSPYRTWVSEIMLQQTRVTAVLPYFARFMDKYPTVAALAAADPEDLMRLWQGLGYYSRARNLQKAAQVLVEKYSGCFPDTYSDILALPGIGDYTAGAILSIAFGQPIPAVDGNVLRVCSRLAGFDGDVLDPHNRVLLRSWMEDVIPDDRPGAFNQALMDLGAGVCGPNGAPHCGDCPAAAFCNAHITGRESVLPVRSGKKEKRLEDLTVFLLRRGHEVALQQRPSKGLLAGLWEYPHAPGKLTESDAALQLQSWGVTPHNWVQKLSATHEFTHIRWEMTGYLIDCTGNGEANWLWCDFTARQKRAIPSAFIRFTEALGGSRS